MKSKLLVERGEKVWAIVFDKGDEVIAGLTAFAKDHRLDSSHFTAIGAFEQATLGYFQREFQALRFFCIHCQCDSAVTCGDCKFQQPRSELGENTFALSELISRKQR